MKRKIVTILLAAAMVLPMTGCTMPAAKADSKTEKTIKDNKTEEKPGTFITRPQKIEIAENVNIAYLGTSGTGKSYILIENKCGMPISISMDITGSSAADKNKKDTVKIYEECIGNKGRRIEEISADKFNDAVWNIKRPKNIDIREASGLKYASPKISYEISSGKAADPEQDYIIKITNTSKKKEKLNGVMYVLFKDSYGNTQIIKRIDDIPVNGVFKPKKTVNCTVPLYRKELKNIDIAGGELYFSGYFTE